MKVFTVGMDQKPPLEKTPDVPPPSYNLATPLPMGPEVPHPIILRKSRGYKGILLVMLAVFLMAIFALTLSEMAYNRQRDENFFRLQLAQLRHRLGFQNQFERNHQFGERIVPVEVTGPEVLAQKALPTTTTEAPRNKFLVDNEPNSESSEQNEVREQMAKDARLQFLRRILQKIKQNAEDMGLEGTMQVSVVEVEPQHVPEFLNNLVGKNRHGEERRNEEERPRFNNPSEDPRSDAFLDSFGEFHAPNPFTGQQPERREHGQPRGRVFGPWQEQQIEIAPPMLFGADEFRPQPPSDWELQRPQIEAFEIRPEGKSQELNNQEIMGEMYGRKFGRMLQDLIAARLQNHFLQQQQMSLIPQRPSFPIEQVQPQQQQGWWGMEQQQPQQPQIPQQPWMIEDSFPRFPQQPQIPQVQQVPEQQPQPAQAQQQAQQAHQALIGEPQRPQPQPEKESAEAQPPAIHPPKAANVELVQDQPHQQVFGGFPQPPQQFPIFIENERQQPQDMNVWPQQPQQQPRVAVDFMPQQQQGPAGWTHQTESEQPTLVDGEVSHNEEKPEDRQEKEESHESPELIILRKPVPVDAQPIHEEPSHLSELPLKELQGELAAAAAALAQQHEAMMAEQAFMQAKEAEKEREDKEEKPEQQEQQVAPAAIQNEQQNEDKTEQVDFPAVKFPHSDAAQSQIQFEHAHSDAEPHIFFQVDEPQPNFGAGHV